MNQAVVVTPVRPRHPTIGVSAATERLVNAIFVVVDSEIFQLPPLDDLFNYARSHQRGID